MRRYTVLSTQYSVRGHMPEQSVGRNKLAQFRQGAEQSQPELRKLVPAYD